MKTKSYRVYWEIDIDATSPEAAAREALAIQRDPASTATVFDVYTEARGDHYHIDLEDEKEGEHK